MDLKNIDLPKWPELRILGHKNVTKDQAAEIILRTESTYMFSSNDKEFEKLLWNCLGVEYVEDDYPHVQLEDEEKVRKDLNSISLYYLSNSQIVSCYVGGPYGWCHWDGRIAAAGYNIGKWPSVEEVLEEFKLIATTFPYLDFTAQLFNAEAGEENRDPYPVVEYRVKDGAVELRKPSINIAPAAVSAVELFIMKMNKPGGERGCTIEQFEHAVEVTRRKEDKQDEN